MASLIILMGSSQSGKSTTARDILAAGKDRAKEVFTFSADDYFTLDGVYTFNPRLLGEAHGTCFRHTVETVREGYDVVVDNTNTTLAEIAPYIALGQAYGYNVSILVHLGNHGDNGHNVPENARVAQAQRVQDTLAQWPPFWPEAQRR